MVNRNDMPAITDTALPVTSWNFETRRVQAVGNDTLRIKPGIMALAFCGVFVLLGLGLSGLWAASVFTAFDGPGSVPLLLIGVLFAAAGLWTYHSSNEQLIINRNTGAAFTRSWKLSVPLDATSVFKHIPRQEIIAIQMTSRVVKHRTNRSRRSSSYTEYQINLCALGTERHNVLITLKPKKAEQLGLQLSRMFGVPLISHQETV